MNTKKPSDAPTDEIDAIQAERQIGRNIAERGLKQLLSFCQTEQQIIGLAEMVCTLSAMLLAGTCGQEYKKDFLRKAINDDGCITPVPLSEFEQTINAMNNPH